MTTTALTSLRTHRELFMNFMMRELRTRYRSSILGWTWSLLNPVALTMVYAIVFSRFLKVTPAPGDPSGMKIFAFFLLAGILPWNFLGNALNTGMASLIGARSLIQKVDFPRELTVLGPVAALSVSLAIELGVLCIAEALAGFITFQFIPVVLVITLLLTLFAMGVTLIVAVLNVRYRDVQHLTSIVLLLGFYLTPVLYSPELIPESSEIGPFDIPTRTILTSTPMSRFIEAYRDCFYNVKLPSLGTMALLVTYSAAAFLAGALFFGRRSARLGEEF